MGWWWSRESDMLRGCLIRRLLAMEGSAINPSLAPFCRRSHLKPHQFISSSSFFIKKIYKKENRCFLKKK